LKHQLVYGGYPELWTLFLQKHMEIQRARKKREAEEKAAKLKRRQEQAMFVLYTIITVAFVSFLIGFVYIVMHV
jgi:cell division protein FtsL